MIVKTKELLQAIKTVSALIRTTKAFPESELIYFDVSKEKLSLYALNITSKAIVTLPCTSEVEHFFALSRKSALALNVLKDEESKFEVLDKKLKYVGKGRFLITLANILGSRMAQDEFLFEGPIVPMDLFDKLIQRALLVTEFKDNQLWMTSGINLSITENEIKLQSCDGFRFAESKLAIPDNTVIVNEIVPGVNFQTLKYLTGSDIQIGKLDSQVFFKTENELFITNTLSGKFPDFNKIINFETDFKIEIEDTTEFVSILNNLKQFSDIIKLDYYTGELSTIHSVDEYSEIFDFKTQIDLSHVFKTKRLLNAIPESMVLCICKDPRKPLYVDEYGDVNSRYGLMQYGGNNEK